MKLTNGQILNAVEASAQLANPMNRLPPVAQIAAGENLHALRVAWTPVNEDRNDLVKEMGVPGPDGKPVVKRDSPKWPEFEKACEELGAKEQEVPIRPIRWADIQAGYSRDPETGKRGLLEIGAEQLRDLRELGIVVEADAKD